MRDAAFAARREKRDADRERAAEVERAAVARAEAEAHARAEAAAAVEERALARAAAAAAADRSAAASAAAAARIRLERDEAKRAILALEARRRNPKSLESRLYGFREKRGRLNLSGLGLPAVDASVYAPLRAAAITAITLERNALTAWPAAVLAGAPNLAHANICENALAALPAGCAARLTGLRRLLLDGNALVDLPWAELGESLGATLTTLSASRNRLRGAAPPVSRFTALEVLRLDGNALEADRVDFRALEALAGGSLRRLDLSRNPGLSGAQLPPGLARLAAAAPALQGIVAERSVIARSLDVKARVRARLKRERERERAGDDRSVATAATFFDGASHASDHTYQSELTLAPRLPRRYS